MSTDQYAVLCSTVWYGIECVTYIIAKCVVLCYGTVRLVRRTEEEKYGTVRYGHLGSTATP